MGMQGRLITRNGKLFVMHEYTLQDTPEARRLYWAVRHTKRNPYNMNFPEAGDTVASTGEGWWTVTNRSAGEAWAGSGNDPAEYDEIVPVPPPKVRKGVELRWYYGEWQKLLKTGWVSAGMGKMPAVGGKRRSKARGGKARASTGPRPVSGYAYRNVEDGDWRGSSDDVWETIMYTPTGNEKLLGERHIDGARVRVFRMDDGWYVAQTAVVTGGKPRKPGTRTTCRRCGARGGYGGVRLWKGFCPQCRAERGKPLTGGKRRAALGTGLIKAAAALKAVWR